MKNIDNKQLRKLIRGKRFKTTVRNWSNKTTTYEYRITNIKLNYGNDDPTTSDQTWKTTVVNIVCSGTTTNPLPLIPSGSSSFLFKFRTIVGVFRNTPN